MRLGRYHLSDCLGGGPTGEVYRAKVYGVAGLDHQFAVKRFHPSLVSDPKAAGLLHAAARLYGALEHPRVARLQEIGEAGGATFVATEYVDGIDLAQLLDQGRLPTGTAAQLVVQIGRALGYAHGRGLSHLGLCPTNVICTVSGDIKVTDFGFLAARLPARPVVDPTLKARLCYLAPEQLKGEHTSPATDVYQLGVMAYQLLVGRRPYRQTDSQALCAAMLAEDPAESGLDKPFDRVLKRALARSPFERFSDAGALADALEAAMRACPVPGSLADAGKAVSKRQTYLLASRESQASGALSFPMPAPPKIPTLARFSAASSDSASPKQPDTPPRIPVPRIPAKPVIATPPHASDTAQDRGRAMSFSDMETTPAHRLREEPPPLTEDILLGPAGTDDKASPRQFIGGNVGATNDDEAGFSRDDRRRADSLDDKETIVNKEPHDGAGGEEALRTPTELEFAPEVFDDLANLEDEVPESIQVPVVAPISVEAPPLPMMNSGHSAGGESGAPWGIPPPSAQRSQPPEQARAPEAVRKKRGSRGPLLLLLFFVAAAAASYVGYGFLTEKDASDSSVAASSSDPDSPGPEPLLLLPSYDAAVAPTDAARDDEADASPTALPIANQLDAGGAVIKQPSEALEIDSTPHGAQVYLDGSLVGRTPITLDPSDDSHRVAVILPGYDLYNGDIEGQGSHTFELVEVATPEGPYGIKVRCVPRNKGRYYIYLDGQPIGQLCPSERLGVDIGKHEIEIYDPITDSRRAFSVTTENAHRSQRVLVD